MVWTVLVWVSLVVLVMKPDEELNEVATNFVNQLQQEKQSRAFMYQQGMSVPAGQNPIEATATLETNVENKYPDRLPLPAGNLFCSISNDTDCIKTLFTHQQNVETIKLEHRELLLRYEHFLSFNEYRTTTETKIDEVFPKYSYFTKAERINVLEAIEYHKDDQSVAAVNLLYGRIAKTRNMFKLQDSLIGKMVYLAILNNLVDVTSIIVSESGIAVDPIILLSPEERDLSEVAAREFGYSYNGVKTIVDDLKDNSWVARGIAKIAFKTNMTVNATSVTYARMESLSTLSFMELSREISMGRLPLRTSMFWNPGGYFLINEFDATDYDKYVVRIFDFNAKLTLFNQRYYKQVDFDAISNPYFKGELSKVHPDKVCFNSFYEEERVRCLKTGIDTNQLAATDN